MGLNVFTTKIGEFDVPVRSGPATIVEFADGHFAFWTAVFKKRVAKRWRVFGRARVGLTAGDRFDRMKRECRGERIPKDDRRAYKQMWDSMGRGANVAYVRPATATELKRWLSTHPEQAGERA